MPFSCIRFSGEQRAWHRAPANPRSSSAALPAEFARPLPRRSHMRQVAATSIFAVEIRSLASLRGEVTFHSVHHAILAIPFKITSPDPSRLFGGRRAWAGLRRCHRPASPSAKIRARSLRRPDIGAARRRIAPSAPRTSAKSALQHLDDKTCFPICGPALSSRPRSLRQRDIRLARRRALPARAVFRAACAIRLAIGRGRSRAQSSPKPRRCSADFGARPCRSLSLA